MTTNDRQVGGTHYESEYQHWDFIEQCGIGYLEGVATKYVVRWRGRGGTLDLRKAIHYVEKLIELQRTHNRLPRGNAPESLLKLFIEENNLTGSEGLVISLLCTWSTRAELRTAARLIERLIEESTLTDG